MWPHWSTLIQSLLSRAVASASSQKIQPWLCISSLSSADIVPHESQNLPVQYLCYALAVHPYHVTKRAQQRVRRGRGWWVCQNTPHLRSSLFFTPRNNAGLLWVLKMTATSDFLTAPGCNKFVFGLPLSAPFPQGVGEEKKGRGERRGRERKVRGTRGQARVGDGRKEREGRKAETPLHQFLCTPLQRSLLSLSMFSIVCCPVLASSFVTIPFKQKPKMLLCHLLWAASSHSTPFRYNHTLWIRSMSFAFVRL